MLWCLPTGFELFVPVKINCNKTPTYLGTSLLPPA